jgi:hypothetical protein
MGDERAIPVSIELSKNRPQQMYLIALPAVRGSAIAR